MKMRNSLSVTISFGVLLLTAAVFVGCSEKPTPQGTNLLANGSFEDVADGLPIGWELKTFRGLDSELPAEWGIDETRAYDGKQSFFFQGIRETGHFFMLTQGFDVKDVRRLRIRGAIRTLEVKRSPRQHPQANFAITCYDREGNRFMSTRFYDYRTKARMGTATDWILEDRAFRIPDNTVHAEFHCVLGMEGKIWFDMVSVEVAEELPWNTKESKNFTFHWLAGSEYPEGSTELQQQLFDYYCARLGIPEEDRPRINSYFYPDSATLYDAVGEMTDKKSFWDEKEVHSIYPVDDHEIVHIITKPYGVLPFALTEGTAFYLMRNYRGQPVLKLAQDLLKEDRLPELSALVEQGVVVRINPDWVAPAAASFVGYLLEIAGPEKFLDLHREANVAAGAQEFGAAFERVYGTSPKDAEAEWRRLLGRLDFSARAAPDTTGVDTTRVKGQP